MHHRGGGGKRRREQVVAGGASKGNGRRRERAGPETRRYETGVDAGRLLEKDTGDVTTTKGRARRGDDRRRALAAIEERGALLVYPLDNRVDPPSLWHALHPRSTMRWEWDAHADSRVNDLWLLREAIARSEDVVYGKWFRGRATFFSRPVFMALLAALETPRREPATAEARAVFRCLEETSPQSTKELKRSTGLEGRFFASTYDKALKSLWEEGRIVGRGEKDDGAFPSLLIGATRGFFEDLWIDAGRRDRRWGEAQLEKRLPADSPFLAFYRSLWRRRGQP
jgi:hypothetical protein